MTLKLQQVSGIPQLEHLIKNLLIANSYGSGIQEPILLDFKNVGSYMHAGFTVVVRKKRLLQAVYLQLSERHIFLVLPSIVSYYCCLEAVASLVLSSSSLSSSTGISGRGALQYVKELNWSGAMSPEGGRPSVLNGGNIWSTRSLSLMYLKNKKHNTTVVGLKNLLLFMYAKLVKRLFARFVRRNGIR